MGYQVNKFNKKIGSSLALLFGLVLLLEVACLPLLTSFAINFDKTVVAEMSEIDQEKIEQRTLSALDFVALVAFQVFPEVDILAANLVFHHDQVRENAIPQPIFILQRSIRV